MTPSETSDSPRRYGAYTPTPAEWRERIEARPEPLDGLAVWDRFGSSDGYEAAGECLARALLILADERPELLDVTAERERDPSGFEAADNDKLWEAAQERWPGLNDWLGGVTGFQYGWAHNIVRYIVGAPPTGNPAIVTVENNV